MDLESQIVFLRDKLLAPAGTRFPAPLTTEDQILVSSFLVLAHAAIEEAIEDFFTLHLKSLIGFTSACSVPADLARAFFHLRASADSMIHGQGPLATTTIGKVCLAIYDRDYIRPNNGVKLDNVKKLASGAGIYWTDFEDALNVELSDLTTLGTKRGSVGHLSPFTVKPVAITTATDPSDVHTWVESGVFATRAIGEFLRSSRQLAMPMSLITDWDGN
jgi:hypothetical protein